VKDRGEYQVKVYKMQKPLKTQTLLVRHIALPQDHGSWVFLISPLIIGLFAGGRWSSASAYLILAALAGFLIRQPASIAVKVYSKRRTRRELPAALFWGGVYALLGLGGLAGLIVQGYGYLLYLAIPAVPVFAWHLYLVSRRSERRQAGVEILGSGVLALAAPAAYWVGRGHNDPMGWWLFGLTWFQSAASIVFAYMRLEQRNLRETPDLATRLSIGRRALLYTAFNLLAVFILSLTGILPILLPIPYLLQWGESLWGALKPAINVNPTHIGVRQLIVSTLFTVLFILAWNI
jgi:hypothetical protein